MISFANVQVSVKIRLACSKVLLLINYFNPRFWATNIPFFVKVGAANVLLKLNNKVE